MFGRQSKKLRKKVKKSPKDVSDSASETLKLALCNFINSVPSQVERENDEKNTPLHK
ncbi:MULTISPECIES: hypothetical protein [Lactococcus]|uniref:Uncharacterized protein n=1 Tax=Lactococcus petauri TaxID=1940789 RepID=A0AAJ2IWZ9_9LACT|nr:hypothetical protein [Lactococcus petauri]MDT2526367.1 hypothetical protein [Lactococcus petauri]MDT2540912.1 hypothetical protein [Lactococcus petauri]MDT2557486.1 hypothetical protein [Lactococcus petauri]MDT2559439.1 hypothetical protein [Lactococcus petauri]MDT2568012.1 hypothetical protein [Lactococcus petauri]